MTSSLTNWDMLCLRHGDLDTSCEKSEIAPLKKMNDNYMMEKYVGPGAQDPGEQN